MSTPIKNTRNTSSNTSINASIQSPIRAEILSVGTEILMGEITNTNARDIARELYHKGIGVYYQSSVGDNRQRIVEMLSTAFGRADLVITTGGLGPTLDDLTKEAAADYFQLPMVLDQGVKLWLEDLFGARGMTVNEGNLRQAYFPKDAIIMENPMGTAPGCIIENQGKTLIILPGPPKEMMNMMVQSVLPYLSRYTQKVFATSYVQLAGIGEGQMEELILDLIRSQHNPTIAPYAREKGLVLRLTAQGDTLPEAEALLLPLEEQLIQRLNPFIYHIGKEEKTLNQITGEILIKNQITLATAESCTGGLLGGAITEVPGISEVYLEGFITYSNEAKIRSLGVMEETLAKHGAVSPEVAMEMARGAAERTGARLGISVTGVAGPEGGTVEKPVGLVYLGLYLDGKVSFQEIRTGGTRDQIRYRTVREAMNLIYHNIK